MAVVQGMLAETVVAATEFVVSAVRALVAVRLAAALSAVSVCSRYCFCSYLVAVATGTAAVRLVVAVR